MIDFFPITGGVGFGRIRISIVFRAVQLQAPRALLGWDYGTLEVQPEIRSHHLEKHLQSCRLKVRTSLSHGKMHTTADGLWRTRHEKSMKLPVRKRYSSALIIEFRSASKLMDKTQAFAVLWLKEIPDEEDQTVTLTVWKGNLKRAETCALDEYGEKLGSIELSLKFWAGLSGYHDPLARKDQNLADVMEVLDAAQDNDEVDMDVGDPAADHPNSSSSSSDDDESSRRSSVSLFKRRSKADSDLSENGKRGTVDQVRDYKQHSKQLHRRNRGLMQWKVSHWSCDFQCLHCLLRCVLNVPYCGYLLLMLSTGPSNCFLDGE